jgi:hypothetical protein
MKWQHKYPRLEGDHVATPTVTNRKTTPICATCGKQVVKVRDDEGPESIKALLKF